MQKEKVSFQEIARFKVNDTTTIVISLVSRDDEGVVGIVINNFVSTQKYTGYSKGVFIPNNLIAGIYRAIGNML